MTSQKTLQSPKKATKKDPPSRHGMQGMQGMGQMPNSAMQGFAPPMGGAY